MADDRGRGLPPPPRDNRRNEDEYYLPHPHHENDERSRGYQPRMPPVSLPPMQDHPAGEPSHIPVYGHPVPPGRYPPPGPIDPRDPRDPRAAANYGPSPSQQQGPHPPPPPPQGYNPQGDPRAPPIYETYRVPQQPFSSAIGYEYSRPPPGFASEYRGPLPHQLQPGAPRQRTSIACKYCRRRKIRCSGYQHGGKCSNCVKMNQECIFQPVSSSASTAFVPISAVQGTLAPGTQLYGAYGQPLQLPTGGPPAYPAGSGDYPHPMQSPTTAHPQAGFDGDRRRPRDEEHFPARLPPPNPYPDGPDPGQRHSPASSTNSPGTYSSYPPPVGAPYEGNGPPPTQRASPNSRGSQPPPSGSSGVMSLGNIMDGPSRPESSIDQNMLSRLNRPR